MVAKFYESALVLFDPGSWSNSCDYDDLAEYQTVQREWACYTLCGGGCHSNAEDVVTVIKLG